MCLCVCTVCGLMFAASVMGIKHDKRMVVILYRTMLGATDHKQNFETQPTNDNTIRMHAEIV